MAKLPDDERTFRAVDPSFRISELDLNPKRELTMADLEDIRKAIARMEVPKAVFEGQYQQEPVREEVKNQWGWPMSFGKRTQGRDGIDLEDIHDFLMDNELVSLTFTLTRSALVVTAEKRPENEEDELDSREINVDRRQIRNMRDRGMLRTFWIRLLDMFRPKIEPKKTRTKCTMCHGRGIVERVKYDSINISSMKDMLAGKESMKRTMAEKIEEKCPQCDGEGMA